MEDFQAATALERMLIKKATAKGIPISATFELTPTCNFNCSMCYMRLSPQRLKELGGLRTVEEWKSTALEMKRMGTLFILLTGGEPLLYPKFEELYSFLANEGFILTLNTNGSLITPEIVKLWKKQLPRRLNITLYGASEETYEKLCHNRSGFQQTLKAFELIKEYDIPARLNISIVEENQNEYDDMRRIAEDFGFPVMANSYMLGGCSILCNDKSDIATRRMNPERAALCDIHHMKYSQKESFIENAKRHIDIVKSGQAEIKTPQGLQCSAGETNCWIDFRGMMLPCTIMEEYGVSLKEHTVEEAWSLIRNTCQNITLQKDCIGCNLSELCPKCWANLNLENKYCGTKDYLCRYANEKKRLLEKILEDRVS